MFAMKSVCICLALVLTMHAYTQEQAASIQFWNRLKKHCGAAYEGVITDGATDDFKDRKLVMHVRGCEPGMIRIPFMVGENRSRTWVLTLKDSLITLKHDHRHEDGSPDKVTFYGGTAGNSGSPTLQVFPADEETRLMIPAAFSNVWWISIDDQYFTYNLRRIGTDRLFTVKFDLRKPVPVPPAPWGWKD